MIRKLISGWALLLAVAGTVLADEARGLTDEERKAAISYLEETRDLVADGVAGLTEAQWRYKSAPDRWSPAEIVEHLALAENLLGDRILAIAESPALPPEARPKLKDDAIRMAITNRQAKRFQAPERLQPSGHFASGREALAEFLRRRAALIAWARETGDDLRARAAELPILGPIDGYQWMLFVGAHCERHSLQLDEVKAGAGFSAAKDVAEGR